MRIGDRIKILGQEIYGKIVRLHQSEVVIFDEDTPVLLIQELAPDLLVKGADYKRKDVVGGDFVEGIGGKVLLVELESGYSTSDTIAKIVGSHDD